MTVSLFSISLNSLPGFLLQKSVCVLEEFSKFSFFFPPIQL